MFGASPAGLEDGRKIDTQLARKPSRKEAKRSTLLQCFGKDQMMADIPDGLRAAYERRYKTTAPDFSLSEQCGFERHAKTFRRRRNRQKASIEP